MNRRSALKALLAPLAASLLPVKGGLTARSITVDIPLSLYGIPYHCTDATTESWCGFTRI